VVKVTHHSHGQTFGAFFLAVNYNIIILRRDIFHHTPISGGGNNDIGYVVFRYIIFTRIVHIYKRLVAVNVCDIRDQLTTFYKVHLTLLLS
jgi:hypothetical protein